MERRSFLERATAALAGASAAAAQPAPAPRAAAASAPARDLWKRPFRRLVVLGESTVEGGAWLARREDRFADLLARLLESCQEQPLEYHNKGISGNAISARSPGYAHSRKPSALERYKADVIDLQPDLFVLCYGLNDMRAGMPVRHFREDMATIVRDVRRASNPMTVLTTVVYMTGWKSWPPYDKGNVALALEYNAAIRRLAAQHDCAVADLWQATAGADWLIHYDGVHANRVGSLVIAHRVFETIARHASGLTGPTFAQDAQTGWTKEAVSKRSAAGDPFRRTW
jgi:lysophospholipase L1-like esterase